MELIQRISHAFEGDPESKKNYYSVFATLFRPGDQVVDLGCGNGTFLSLLQAVGAFPLGVERDPIKIKEARDKDLTVIPSDILSVIPLLPDKVEGFVLAHIIEHFPPLEFIPYLDNLVKSKNPQKMLIITPNISHTPVLENFWLDITHVRPYPNRLLATILTEIGFPFVQIGTGAQNFDVWAWAYSDPRDEIILRNNVLTVRAEP